MKHWEGIGRRGVSEVNNNRVFQNETLGGHMAVQIKRSTSMMTGNGGFITIEESEVGIISLTIGEGRDIYANILVNTEQTNRLIDILYLTLGQGKEAQDNREAP
jgi:hypothetical protein